MHGYAEQMQVQPERDVPWSHASHEKSLGPIQTNFNSSCRHQFGGSTLISVDERRSQVTNLNLVTLDTNLISFLPTHQVSTSKNRLTP